MPIDDNTPAGIPKGSPGGMAIRAGLNAIAGVIPVAGGLFAAAAGTWSEREQQGVNKFLEYCWKMIQEDLADKAKTILEIISRLDMHDEKIAERVASPEYQSLVRKALREWAGGESEAKREYVRNILSHAADASLADDDVVRMFLQWINMYSELHFRVIAAVYNDSGVTRARIWEKVGKMDVREDSAEADLFRLLIRDLSTGGIIRQHREKDHSGNFLRQPPVQRRRRRSSVLPSSNTMESAFEDTKGYELTGLGDRFVHYAMTDLPPKIEFKPTAADPTNTKAEETGSTV